MEGLCRGIVVTFLTVVIGSHRAGAQAPNDPDFPLQWALRNTGQSIQDVLGKPGADISMVEAWALFTPVAEVVVAIVGAGVSPHPEFADRLLPGYVTSQAGGDPYSTLDTVGLETRLAGIIAARRDDSVGTAGVNDRAWILPVRALTGSNGGNASVAEGIRWAADAGAAVILVARQVYQYDQALDEAVQYARQSGAMVVAPVGDFPAGSVAFPAALPECLAVASTDSRDEVADFSNRGPEVDVAAPGVGIWSTTANGGNGFETASSSAFAAAYAAGVASMIRAQAPWLNCDEVASIVQDTAEDDVFAPGWDEARGWGRLDAARAMEQLPRPSVRFHPDHPIPSRFSPSFPTTLTVRVSGADEQVEGGPVTAVIRWPGSAEGRHAMSNLHDGRYAIILPPFDCGESISFYFTAQGEDGTVVSHPWNAPTEVFSATYAFDRTLFQDDFEGDLGWTVATEGIGATGAWVRVVPVGTSAQPAFDHSQDEGSRCFVTGQHTSGGPGSNDVDGGPVRLTSPIIGVSDDDVEISYARWFHTESGTPDALTVEVSRDAGANWSAVETVSTTTHWTEHRFRLSDFPGLIDHSLQLRFSTSDLDHGSLTEAAIDDVVVREIVCDVASGDVSGDGTIDLRDATIWHDCLATPYPAFPADPCFRMDRDQDLRITLFDFQSLQNQFAP